MSNTKQFDRIEMLGLIADEPLKWTNKALGEHFGVSTVSIWKARKRAANPPKEKVLKPDQVTWVENKKRAPHLTHKALGELCFPDVKDPEQKSQAMAASPVVQRALATELEKIGLTADYKANKIKKHCDSPDDTTSLKGLDMALKVTGDYAPKENLNVNLNADISPVDLGRFKTR